MNKNKKTVRPIRFHKLEVGSRFTIFAEPSRGVQLSNDPATYVKTAASYSTELGNDGNAIVLDFEDLVVPRSRPKN